MLVRLLRTQKISPDGFTVLTAQQGLVYQLPDDLGRVLVAAKDAAAVDANTSKDALPRARILVGRRPSTDAEA